jgi:L-amino acid N-acyltransferase YncA
VETAGAPFWRLLRHYRPDARIITIRRPVEEVKASLRARFPMDEQRIHTVLHRLDHKLDQIEYRTDAVRFEYADLANEDICATLFEYCLPYDHDHHWWQAMDALNLQVNLSHLFRYMQAHAPQLEKVSQQAKHRIASLFAKPTEIDGVDFQCEDWPTFYRDGKALISDHLAATDQAPYAHEEQVNLEMFAKLDELGALQVMTARSNGRIFGYLLSVICPALDRADKIVAVHTAFYGSPLFKGLGMKLQRAALEALKARGVQEVQMRAGHRGAGPRLGTFYQRLGAEQFGQLYRLEM